MDLAIVTDKPLPPPAPMTRWYYSCGDCLTPVAFEGLARPPAHVSCVCGGLLTLVGRVMRARVVVDAHRCACDGRCTYAKGPSCDCECGGANHGTGRVETYTIDQGRATLVARAPEVLIQRATEFREAREDVGRAIAEHPRLTEALEDRRAGRMVGYALHCATTDLTDAFSAAKRLKVHSTRIKRLKKLAADIRAGVY